MWLGSCPAAGSCQAVCLNRAGNPAYLKGKLQRRKLRSLAFYDHPRAFKRLLVLEILRFASKHQDSPTLGLRLNGTSDYRWECETVDVDSDLAGYVSQAFGFTLPVGTWSLFSCCGPWSRPSDHMIIPSGSTATGQPLPARGIT